MGAGSRGGAGGGRHSLTTDHVHRLISDKADRPPLVPGRLIGIALTNAGGQRPICTGSGRTARLSPVLTEPTSPPPSSIPRLPLPPPSHSPKPPLSGYIHAYLYIHCCRFPIPETPSVTFSFYVGKCQCNKVTFAAIHEIISTNIRSILVHSACEFCKTFQGSSSQNDSMIAPGCRNLASLS